jgi:ankyrin repeat protein
LLNHTALLLLLEKGAKIGMVNDEGLSVLHIAIANGLPEIITTLLEHGAKIDSDMADSVVARGKHNLLRLLLPHYQDSPTWAYLAIKNIKPKALDLIIQACPNKVILEET